MALIPPDVGLRMRLQAETSLLQPTGAVHEIGADLPPALAALRGLDPRPCLPRHLYGQDHITMNL